MHRLSKTLFALTVSLLASGSYAQTKEVSIAFGEDLNSHSYMGGSVWARQSISKKLYVGIQAGYFLRTAGEYSSLTLHRGSLMGTLTHSFGEKRVQPFVGLGAGSTLYTSNESNPQFHLAFGLHTGLNIYTNHALFFTARINADATIRFSKTFETDNGDVRRTGSYDLEFPVVAGIGFRF